MPDGRHRLQARIGVHMVKNIEQLLPKHLHTVAVYVAGSSPMPQDKSDAPVMTAMRLALG